MPTYANDIQQVSAASMSGAQFAVQSGGNQYASVVTGGMQRMMSDLGRMMPAAPSVNAHPYMQVRHGMYGQEMSLGGDMGAMMGMGTPETTTMYEYQAMAREDFSRRTTNAVAFGALNTAAAAGGWIGGGALMGKAGTAYKAGKALAAAKNMGTVGAMAAGGLAAAVPIAAGMVAFEAFSATAGKVIGDIQDRQDIGNYLEASSFRYMQGDGADVDSKQGAGFNRKARGKIAEAIKKVDLGDSRFNMQDLKGILEKGTELGMFEGTKDAEDFGKKFKDLTGTLKSITRVLHQSLSEGMQTIKDLKGQGYSGAGIGQAVMQADVLGTATGRTAAEMLSIGRQGSEMVRGTGIALATGSSMMQQTYGMLKSAISAGTLDKEMVAQGGGVGALTQQVMGQSLGMLNSDVGRGYMLSVMQKGGGLDSARLDNLVSGQTSIGQAVANGTGNLQTGADYIGAINSRGQTMRDITSRYGEMGGMLASTGVELSMAKEVAASQGVSTREAFKFIATQRGESESSIEARLSVFDNADEFGKKQSAAFSANAKKTQMEAYRDRADIIGRFSDRVDRAFSPISQSIGSGVDKMQQGVADMYEGATDWVAEKITGVQKVEGVAISNKKYAELFAGGSLDDMGDSAERTKLEKYTYTKKGREAFTKGDGYKSLDEKYGKKIRSSAASSKSGDLNAFSSEVFGKSYDDLTEEEIMYMETVSEKMGHKKNLALISEKRREASTSLKDIQADRMLGKEKGLKQAIEEQEDVRDETVDALFSGVGIDIAKRAFSDERTAKPLEDLIIQSGKVSQIEQKIATAESKGNTAMVSKLKKQLSTEQGKMTSIKEKASVALGGGQSAGTAMSQIESQVAKNPDAFTSIAGRLGGAARTAESMKDLFSSTQFITGMQDNVERLKDDASTSLSSDEQGSLSDMLDSIQEGDSIDADDATGFMKIARKSGSSAIGHIAQFAARVTGKEERGQLKTTAQVEKFLEGTGTLNMIEKDKRASYIETNFMDDGKLDTARLLKFELGMTTGDKEGGTKFKGGGARAGDSVEGTASAAVALQNVQSKSADVLRQLQILSVQLAKTTKEQ